MDQEPQQASLSISYKKLFYGLLITVIIGVVGCVIYINRSTLFSKSDNLPSVRVEPQIPPSTPPSQLSPVAPPIGLPLSPTTVAFATTLGGDIFLRYEGKVYAPISGTIKEASATNFSEEEWLGLVKAPDFVQQGEFMFDEFFGFNVAPNKESFMFIMRWGDKKDTAQYWPKYYIYRYVFAAQKPGEQIKAELFDIYPKSNGKPVATEWYDEVPLLGAFSPQGDKIEMIMHGCWNCGPGHPLTKLIDLTTKKEKRLGKIFNFEWTTNNSYRYKEYKARPCGEGEEGMGECAEDPNTLPYVNGEF